MMFSIFNKTKQEIVALRGFFPESFSDRLRGMIGRDFSAFDGMMFDRCNAIHTFFMSIPLDIIFLSKEKKVLKTVTNFSPWMPFLYCKNAYYVIELPVGKIMTSKTAENDLFEWCPEFSAEREETV